MTDAPPIGYHWSFASFEEWLREAVPHAINKEFCEGPNCLGQVYSSSDSKNWYGVEDGLDGVYRRIHDGWPEGLARLREVKVKTTRGLPTFRKARRRPRRSDHGDELDIHAVRSGKLDKAWRRTMKLDGRGTGVSRRVRVVMDIGANCTTDSATMFWSPAAALVLCERLVMLGYAVEIVAALFSRHLCGYGDEGHGNTLMDVTVKSFDRPANMESLAILALSGLFRGPGFATLCKANKKVRPSLGHMVPIDRFAEHLDKGDATTLITPRITNERQALSWVNDVLESKARPASEGSQQAA